MQATNQAEPIVSVVTPFFNSERYLAQCIESVLCQTYTAWEYCLVNNCSRDRSEEIALQYAKKDRRLRLINNDKFLGQVQNYNHALRSISTESKYCKIVQADEWIFPTCLEEMVRVAEENPSVGIVGSYWLKDSTVDQHGLPYPQSVESGRKLCRLNLLHGQYYFGNPTSLLFRSDIVRSRNRFYDETSLYEDTEACYEILREHDFGFVHQVLTFWRSDNYNASISAVFKSFDPGYYLSTYTYVCKFGPVYLNPSEYHRCLTKAKRSYYIFLAKNLLLMRGGEFWGFHKKGHELLGLKLKMRELSKYIFILLLDLGLNPKSTVERVIAYIKQRYREHMRNVLEVRDNESALR
jgi:glycosyltransferase involved in cell wall biosynthesis